MTLKEFFIKVRAHFLEDHAAHNQDSDERWMTEGLCASMTEVGKFCADSLRMEASIHLERHRPFSSGAWWFPTSKSYGYDECISPRLAILDKIIASL